MNNTTRDRDGLFEFKPDNGWPANVYQVLIRHQQTEEWEPRPLMEWFYSWARLFIVEFDLKIPTPPIALDRLRANRFAHFMPGHNCWGLEGEIKINANHLLNRPSWQVLGTLCHELIHAWQQKYGRPSKSNYHNMELRKRADVIGLLIDARGVTDYAASKQPDEFGKIGYDSGTPFRKLLDKHGVAMPVFPTKNLIRKPGGSKLKLWRCRCIPAQNARIGRGEFHAICPLCGEPFERVDWVA